MMSASLRCFCLLALTYSIFNAVNGCPQSCQEIKDSAGGSAASGEYSIYIPRLKSQITVYCEMGLNGGGYTFIRPFDLLNLIDSDIQRLFNDKSNVMMRLRMTNGSQPYAVLQQLPQHNSTSLTVHLNDYSSFTQPQNAVPLGTPYLLLGFLPAGVAGVVGGTEGFQVNGNSVSYVNCDGKAFSYIALFANFNEQQPSTYGTGWTFPFTTQFLQLLQPNPSRREMPSEYFTFMELSQGGCGAYTQTDGRPGLPDVLSASIGFR